MHANAFDRVMETSCRRLETRVCEACFDAVSNAENVETFRDKPTTEISGERLTLAMPPVIVSYSLWSILTVRKF